MKHTYFINIEGVDLEIDKLKDIFDKHQFEVDEKSVFAVLKNDTYLDSVELDLSLNNTLDIIIDSGISIGQLGIQNISLWLNVYNKGNPFCWSFLNQSLIKKIGNLDMCIELDFYPIELTKN